jgi:hypothetical protein
MKVVSLDSNRAPLSGGSSTVGNGRFAIDADDDGDGAEADGEADGDGLTVRA